MNNEKFNIRKATLEDVEIIVKHRCAMFTDMNRLKETGIAAMAEQTRQYLREAMPGGEYLGWLIYPDTQPDLVIAGGGIQLRRILPTPSKDGTTSLSGLQALVLNIYTESEWRKRGLAELIMREILTWCKENENQPVNLVLHASTMGRPIYEKLGFVQTNEMRFEGSYDDFGR